MANTSDGQLNLSQGLKNAYLQGSGSAAQVIRVPHYRDATFLALCLHTHGMDGECSPSVQQAPPSSGQGAQYGWMGKDCLLLRGLCNPTSGPARAQAVGRVEVAWPTGAVEPWWWRRWQCCRWTGRYCGYGP